MIDSLQQVNKIIAFRNDRFGEFLLNIPAFKALKKGYPQAKLVLVTNSYVRELARLIDGVNEVIVWENKKHRLNEIIGFSRKIKQERFELCVIFNPSKEFNIISFLSGIPKRIGYNHKFAFLLTKKIEDRKYLGERHEVEYNLNLAIEAGAKIDGCSLSLSVNEGLVQALLREFGIGGAITIVALHPWTSDPLKQWPIDNFTELARRLATSYDIKIFVIGGKEETAKSKEFFNNLKLKNIINLTGRTTLVELAAFLKICKLLISGDSGPVHLASAVATPVIAIFRNDIPAKGPTRWGPWGQGHMVIEKNNLKDISVDEVFAKTKEKLGIV